MDRRTFLKGTMAAGAGLVLPWTEPITFAGAATRCHLGAYAGTRPGETPQQAVLRLERLIGRKLAVTRHYVNWGAPMPGSFIEWSAKGGRKPYVAWHCEPHTWRSIASGSRDTWIKTQARAIKAAGHPMYFAFHHEPENDTALGSAADYVAAYSHVRRVFDSVGVSNLTWVVTLMASTFDGGHGGAERWLPSGSRYDLVGVDGYNRFPCLPNRASHPWRSFASIFRPAHDLAVSSGKGLFIGELGSVEEQACGYRGDPTAKSRWIDDARATAQQWPELAAMVYSHTQASYQGFTERFWVDSSSSSLTSFRHMAADPYFL